MCYAYCLVVIKSSKLRRHRKHVVSFGSLSARCEPFASRNQSHRLQQLRQYDTSLASDWSRCSRDVMNARLISSFVDVYMVVNGYVDVVT
jgi:hypothetical protein